MNAPAAPCTASLSGWVEGETWTRWRQAGEGQVRFWLRPVRESLGLLLCAIPVRTAGELRTAQAQYMAGRAVEIIAEPMAADKSEGARDEALSRVVFLVVRSDVSSEQPELSLPGLDTPSADDGHPHHPRITGKMAAAGEHEEDVS